MRKSSGSITKEIHEKLLWMKYKHVLTFIMVNKSNHIISQSVSQIMAGGAAVGGAAQRAPAKEIELC